MVLSNRAIRLIFTGFMGIVGFVLLIWFGVHEYPRMHAIEGPDGRTTQGVIVQAIETNERNKHIYEGTIAFKDDKGAEHQFTDSFAYEVWQTLKPGEQAEVRYLSTDPEFAYCTTSYKATRKPIVVVLMCLTLMTVGGIGFLVTLTSRR
jgi:hypothetical protein